MKNACRPHNPNHTPVKRVGTVGVSVSVGQPTPEEFRLGERMLAPLRERLAREPFPVLEPQALEPNKVKKLLNFIRHR